MEKHTQDKSSIDTKAVTGQDPDRYEQGYGSFTEKDYDEKKGDENANQKTPDVKGETEKANIKVGMNEDENTVSNTSAPSGNVSDVQGDKTDTD